MGYLNQSNAARMRGPAYPQVLIDNVQREQNRAESWVDGWLKDRGRSSKGGGIFGFEIFLSLRSKFIR